MRLVVLLSNLPSRALQFLSAGAAVTAHARAHGPRVGYMLPSFARQMQEQSDKWDKTKDRETIAASYSSQKGSDPTGAGDAFTYDSSEASGATYNGVYYNDGKTIDRCQAAATFNSRRGCSDQALAIAVRAHTDRTAPAHLAATSMNISQPATAMMYVEHTGVQLATGPILTPFSCPPPAARWQGNHIW